MKKAIATPTVDECCPHGLTAPLSDTEAEQLADAGLITKEKLGRWVNCTIVPERVAALRDALHG